tara:strand:+ start:5076 stop:6140 length:1065 start_codon:yes stop_codon:yes gene_type:complete
MHKVIVPRENVNDEEVTIVKIHHKSDTFIKKDDCIVEIETTKVNIEIDSPIEGYLSHSLSEGDVLKVGSVICEIDDGSVPQLSKNSEDEVELVSDKTQLKISKIALSRAKELNVDISQIKSGMVTISDIEKMAAKIENSNNIHYVKGIKAKNSIVIIGGGGHAKTCIDILKQNSKYEIIGIVDSKIDPGTDIMGIKVIGDNSILQDLRDDGVSYAVNGVGSVSNPKIRKKVYQLIKDMGFQLPNIIHPSAVIEPSAKYGEGNQFMMGCSVGSDTVINDNCLINSGAIVSHDSMLHSHCHIAPGAILAGSVDIGTSSLIGMGSTIYIGVKVGKETIIHNGINVFNDIDDMSIIQE